MRHPIRLTAAALAVATLVACSHSSDQPQLSDDLKQDLATAGGGDVQLPRASGARLDVVSAAERTNGAVAKPKAPVTTRATSPTRTTRAAASSARPETPAATPSAPSAPKAAPAEAHGTEPAPEAVPAQGRPTVPRPSTQKEPPGGWKTPGQVIRNAPFPINP